MDVPVIFGIGMTNGVIICIVGVLFSLIMFIALMTTLSHGKEKEKRLIEQSVSAKSNASKAKKRENHNETKTIDYSNDSTMSTEYQKTKTMSADDTVTINAEKTVSMDETVTKTME